VLTTWGGGDFNTLIKLVLIALEYEQALVADSYSISGFTSLPIGSPADLGPVLDKAVLERKIKLAAANAFREATAQYRYLGKKLQSEESYRSLPLDSCLRWLSECNQGIHVV
jgi:hypothetical protein